MPESKSLKAGTLNAIVKDVASYLDVERPALLEKLFGR